MHGKALGTKALQPSGPMEHNQNGPFFVLFWDVFQSMLMGMH
jgi:hypothetical protein